MTPIFGIRQLVMGDYPFVCEWWRHHGFPILHKSMLTEEGRIVVDAEGRRYAAGWIYFTPSRFVLFEWVVANPEHGLKTSHQAVEWLIGETKKEIEAEGLTIFSWTKSRGLARIFERHGFTVDEGLFNMTFSPGAK